MEDEENLFDKYDEYLSKSRVKTWVKCPREFYYKYVKDIKTEETESMVRGTAVHESIEGFYENAAEYVEENESAPEMLFELMVNNSREDWRDYLDPYLINFLGFERRRLEQVDSMEEWLPVGVEEENWEKIFGDDIPILMGYADVLLPASSFPNAEVPYNSGCVLIDFKTGDLNRKYTSPEQAGVYLDLAFYSTLFDDEFDIVAVGAYYPKEDSLITSDVSEDRQNFIEKVCEDISEADEDDLSDYPTKEGPLCAWGEGEDERCDYYNQCVSTWGVPIDNQERVIELFKKGHTKQEVAKKIGTSNEALDYWIRKKSWFRYINPSNKKEENYAGN